MRIRLNRWQQIGVVLSVLAFVGIGIYAWVFEARHRDSFYITQITMCYNTLRSQNDAFQVSENKRINQKGKRQMTRNISSA